MIKRFTYNFCKVDHGYLSEKQSFFDFVITIKESIFTNFFINK